MQGQANHQAFGSGWGVTGITFHDPSTVAHGFRLESH
jgi:hypothetical protein